MTLCGCFFPHQFEDLVPPTVQKQLHRAHAQLQQLVNVGGHSPAQIWFHYLPELTLYAAEIILRDGKPELIHPAGWGQLPTKRGVILCDSSYKQEKLPRNNCEPAEPYGRPASKHNELYIINHMSIISQLQSDHTAALRPFLLLFLCRTARLRVYMEASTSLSCTKGLGSLKADQRSVTLTGFWNEHPNWMAFCQWQLYHWQGDRNSC